MHALHTESHGWTYPTVVWRCFAFAMICSKLLSKVLSLYLSYTSAAGGGAGLHAASGSGQPGTLLLPHDAKLAVLRPLRAYAAGELCAFREKPSPAEAAALAAQIRAQGRLGPFYCGKSDRGC
jgi:hypothetical protein